MKPLLSLLLAFLLSFVAEAQIPGANATYLFTNGSTAGLSRTGTAGQAIPDRINVTNDAIQLNGDHFVGINETVVNLSVSFWIKTANTDGVKKVILEQSTRTADLDNTNSPGWYVYLKDGKVGLAANYTHSHVNSLGNTVTANTGYGYYQSTSTVADDQWHNIIVTAYYNSYFDGSGMVKRYTYSVYVDGVLENSQVVDRGSGGSFTNISGALVTNPRQLVIANNGSFNLGGSRYQDALDDVRYYRGTINGSNIASLAAEKKCAPPTSLSVNSITTESATIQWDANEAIDSWDILLLDHSQIPVDSIIITGITDANYPLTGLSPETDYTVFLRSNCTDFSGWYSNPLLFTTLCLSASVEAITQDITVYLDVNGVASIVPQQVDAGSIDACGNVPTLSLDITEFDCSNVGPNSVTLAVEDANGNIDSQTATVTVVPSVLTKDIIIQLNANGEASISTTDIDNGTLSICSGFTLSLSKTDFTCADLGANQVELIAEDGQGNLSTSTATVTVVDEIAPSIHVQNTEVSLDELTGVALVTPAMIVTLASDNCGSDLIYSLSQSSFNCNELGQNTIIITAQDASGNQTSEEVIITVLSDITDEVVSTTSTNFCPDGSTEATISIAGSMEGVDYYLRNSADNSIVDGPIAGTGNAIDFNTGLVSQTNTYNVFAKGAPQPLEGNALEFDGVNDKVEIPFQTNLIGTGDFTVEAWVFPTKTEYSRLITRFSGSTTVAGDFLIDTYSTSSNNGRHLRLYMLRANNTAAVLIVDNVLTLSTWNHVAATLVGSTLTLYVNGEVASTTSFGQTGFTNNTGSWVLGEDRGGTINEFFKGKMDEVRFWNIGRSIEQIQSTMNTCLQGNETGLTAYYTFENEPGATTLSDQSVNSNTGNLINMDANTAWVSGQTLTCQDNCGGFQLSTQITIGDTEAPTATGQDLTIYLDAAGQASIVSDQLVLSLADNCTDENELIVALDQASFDCSNLGEQTVTISVTDAGGNQTLISSLVTVVDTLAPMVITKDFTLELTESGEAILQPSDIDNGTSDNCAFMNLFYTLDKSVFTCSDLGENPVTLTATDASGNQSSATAMVTVVDNLAPEVTVQSVEVYLDSNGNATLSVANLDIVATDNCTDELDLSYELSKTTFSCSEAGDLILQLTLTDANNNSSVTPFTVSVLDTLAPTVVTKNITANLDQDGVVSITAAFVNNGSFDNCTATGSLLLSLNISSFTVADLGDNTVMLTVTDASGNSQSAEAIVTVTQKTEQSITFNALENKVYGAPNVVLNATASSGLPLVYTVLEGPATVLGNSLEIKGTGTVTVEASQAGDETFAPASAVIRSFEVAKANLIITADNKAISYGDSMPTLTYQYTGFVNNEGEDDLDQAPGISTNADPNSSAGIYVISLSEAQSANYAFTYVNGTLTINKAIQVISITTIPSKPLDSTPFEVEATVNTFLPLSYSIVSGPASINGNIITLTGQVGTVEVQVLQAGNENFEAISANTSFEVFNPNPCVDFMIASASQANNLCAGASNGLLSLSISGGTLPYQYAWSNGGTAASINNLPSGTYSVIITDANNCELSFSATITEPSAVEINFTSLPNTSVQSPNGSISISVEGGVEPYTFQWNNGLNTQNLQNLVAGVYTVTVTDANACQATQAITVVADLISGMHPLFASSLRLYPNPVNSELRLQADMNNAETVRIILWDASGRMLETRNLEMVLQLNESINMASLSKGMYHVQIMIGDEVMTHRIVKE